MTRHLYSANDSLAGRDRRHSVTQTASTIAVLVGAFVLTGGGRNAVAQAQGNAAPPTIPIAAPRATDQPATVAADNPYLRRVQAPGLEGGEWVNVPKPLSLNDFRGRFVLLDFWTFCCINCMHVLPELKKLEHAYPNELVVVGIQSAKFDSEHVTDNVRQAALRYEIEHPVVNDANMAIWNRYGARSWPTLVLIDPLGDVVWASSGERTAEEIKAVIDHGLPYYRANGLLKPAPRPTLLPPGKLSTAPLQFPGELLADSASGRLFIADSNHNRIVVASLDGKLLDTIGSGEIGRADGAFAAASFNHPQGLALVGQNLYAADNENHLLRKVDLAAKNVKTIAGTGRKGNGWPGMFADDAGTQLQPGASPRRTPLTTSISSPWALWHNGNDLFIAMAGTHQIWRMPLDESSIAPYAGNGRENIVDGPLLPTLPYDQGFASFAQPSGLTSDGKRLFVADSEGSTVRSVPFDEKGVVQTLVGLTGTLFDFGDIDGTGQNVRLQHPLDVAWADGTLYVADTYNNKIKAIDVSNHSCHTIAGTGAAGSADAATGAGATFNEPTGLTAANGRLYVADTNSHLIRVVELAPPNRVSTLKINGLAAPQAK